MRTPDRSLLRGVALTAFTAICGASPGLASEDPTATQRPPNIVFIFADDLGYGEVGCYGQDKIRTPHIDSLARDGMRFTQFYSGSCVCASARCSLLTGRDMAHAYVRGNHEMGGWERGNKEGQLPLPAGTFTLGHALQSAGYATACVGKWGLGGPGSSGEPLAQGFDHFYGYLCQRQAHNYYPEHLWCDREKVVLEGNTWKNVTGAHFAPDLMIDDALQWMERHAAERPGEPFFLYYATPVPHVALQVPEDSLVEYPEEWDATGYDGSKGYLPHPRPRAAYAAMVTRMDRDVGRLLALLDGLGLRENTLVVFSSDNGPTYNGGADSKFFESSGGLRGRKGNLFEGGIRVPFLVRWPGRVAAGSVTEHVAALWDLMPTFAAAAGVELTVPTEGISLLPLLEGRGSEQEAHESLYWEYHPLGGWQAARFGRWKAVRNQAHKQPDKPIMLFDLEADPHEERDVAAAHPELVARAAALFEARTQSHMPRWNFPAR